MSLQSLITEHWAGIAFVSLYVFLALIATMPVPGDPRPVLTKLYEWVYDFFHVLSNKIVERHPQAALPQGEEKKNA